MSSMKWVVGGLILASGLLALNLVLPRGPQIFVGEALAQNRGTSGGDYVVAAARTTSTSQMLYVADARTKKLLVYAIKPGRSNAELVGAEDLNRQFPGGCSGQVILQPFEVTSSLEGLAVIDTVNRKMAVFTSANYGRPAMMGAADLGKDAGL